MIAASVPRVFYDVDRSIRGPVIPVVFKTIGDRDPGLCGHPRVKRLGTQRLPFPPFRLHLVNCVHCGDTLAIESLRARHEALRREAGASQAHAGEPVPSNRLEALDAPKKRRLPRGA
jgi:hypothetical protein